MAIYRRPIARSSRLNRSSWRTSTTGSLAAGPLLSHLLDYRTFGIEALRQLLRRSAFEWKADKRVIDARRVIPSGVRPRPRFFRLCGESPIRSVCT